MQDQADTLRRLMRSRNQDQSLEEESRSESNPHVITVASGKGGVGKSCFVANMGAMLARTGLRVLMVDGDMGLANLDILMGVQAHATLEQVLSGTHSVQDTILGIEPNLWLLPSSSGLMSAREQDTAKRADMITFLETLPWEMDVILMDVGAGIQNNVLNLHNPVYHSVIVLTPEPTSMTDAYGLIKLLNQKVGIQRVSVVVNQVSDGREAQLIFQRLRDVASRFVDVEIDYLGHWERDEKITQSVMKRKILLDLDSGARSIASLELVAKRLRSHKLGESEVKRFHHSPGVRMDARFKDEPARLAPGNGARFWRTLLGGVKA